MKISVRLVIKGSLGEGFSVKLKTRQNRIILEENKKKKDKNVHHLPDLFTNPHWQKLFITGGEKKSQYPKTVYP